MARRKLRLNATLRAVTRAGGYPVRRGECPPSVVDMLARYNDEPGRIITPPRKPRNRDVIGERPRSPKLGAGQRV
jgi:hypothetical protein